MIDPAKDFSDTPTLADPESEAKAKALTAYWRRVEFHIASWEADELTASWNARCVEFFGRLSIGRQDSGGTEAMTAVDVLRNAKADIETRGWFHGPTRGYQWTGKHGATCAAVAIENEAGIATPLYQTATAYLKRAIGSDRIMAWNDAPGRTVEEVLAAFDRAIEIAEGK